MTETQHSTPPGTVTALGDGALRLETEDTQSATAAGLALREAAYRGVRDVVVGLHSVVVIFDPLLADPPNLAARLREVDRTPIRPGSGRRISVPVRFDGSDLAEVGDLSGLGVRGTVDALTAAEFTVALLGFSPGFAYLTGLPPALARIPRRSSPRPSVAAGSVALAGGYAAVYPQSTPGGWQVVGRTALSLFDSETPPYALVSSGDRLSFFEVDAVIGPRPVDAERRGAGSPPSPVGSIPTFVVEHPGTLSLIQDGGRVGLAHLGVPAAGSADPVSARLANALVGNPPGTPSLEIAGRGPVLTCRRSCFVAAVGGEPRLWLDGSEVLTARVVPVATGQRLAISGPERGMRTYLAVAGGFSVAPTMMSTSTDVLSGLGPGPLAASDELNVGAPISMLADHLVADTAAPAHPGRRVLRVLPGPEADWLEGATLHSLAARRFVVESASDRIGVRLRADGDHGPIGRREGEMSSSGMVTGAVQLPPSGQPIVLLPDHATLGGYPVVAVVITADLGELGQCAPGEEVLFAPVSPEEAAQALSSLERSLQRAVAGHYPLVSG